MIKAILFDLDETLLDQQWASSVALREFHREKCLEMTWTEVEARWNNCLKNHFIRYEKGEITFQQQRRCRIRDIFEGRDIPDELADQLFGVYLKNYEGIYRLFPEVNELLSQLGRFPLGVITNGDTQQQLDKLTRMDIKKYFNAILVSEAVGLRKPDTKIFELAAKNIGVKTNECIFVGDNLEADYRGSAEAGMQAILVNRKNCDYGEKVRQISNLMELKKYLP